MASDEFKYPKLRGRIVEKFRTYNRFAKHMKMQNSTLSAKLSGRQNITKTDMMNWGNELEIPKDEYGLYFF